MSTSATGLRTQIRDGALPPRPVVEVGDWDPCFKPGPCPCPTPCKWVEALMLPVEEELSP